MATKRVTVESIGSYFESLTDPRHTRNRKHLFIDIVVIAVCGLVCGCDGPTAIRRWATHRARWLQGFLTLPNGVPSRDCIRNLLMAFQPEAFQKCFQDWIANAVVTDEARGICRMESPSWVRSRREEAGRHHERPAVPSCVRVC